MNDQNRIVSIILAAGKGTRMKSPSLHKVCFPIQGKTVIARALATYTSCNIDTHIIVVGYRSEQVMQTARAANPNVFFTLQHEQKGTGHAARVGAELLRKFEYDGDVFIVAGDKVYHQEDCIWYI